VKKLNSENDSLTKSNFKLTDQIKDHEKKLKDIQEEQQRQKMLEANDSNATNFLADKSHFHFILAKK